MRALYNCDWWIVDDQKINMSNIVEMRNSSPGLVINLVNERIPNKKEETRLGQVTFQWEHRC